MYRLGHGVSYSTLSELFGVSISLASETFNKVCRVLVAASYDQYVTLPKTDEEWESEAKGFTKFLGFTKALRVSVRWCVGWFSRSRFIALRNDIVCRI